VPNIDAFEQAGRTHPRALQRFKQSLCCSELDAKCAAQTRWGKTMTVGTQEFCFPDPQAATVPAPVYWREAIIQRRFGLDCRLHRGQPFRATLRAWDLGSVKLAHMTLGGHSVLSESKIASRFNHGHLFLKIVCAGRVTFQQAGADFTLRGGEMLVVDPVRPFTESFGAPTELVLLMLPKRELRERGVVLEDALATTQLVANPESSTLWHLLVNIARHSAAATPELRARLGDQVLDLADFLIEGPASHHRSRTSAATCTRIKCYVRQHLGDPTLNTAAIAAAVRVSPRSINRLLAAEGISLMHYLWDCRLQQARTLLLSGRVPKLRIEEIAWRCGFSDPTHFSRSFKSRYGVPPRQFRRSPQGFDRRIEESTSSAMDALLAASGSHSIEENRDH
jgi:AraC-like DNA-binding protein